MQQLQLVLLLPVICYRSFYGGKDCHYLSFQIWVERQNRLRSLVWYLFFHISSGLLLLLVFFSDTTERVPLRFSLEPLTNALEAGDLGAWLVLLGIGIKAAFPGLHVVKDGYAEATPFRSGLACVHLPLNVRFVCSPIFSRYRYLGHYWWSDGHVPHFLCGD